MVSNPVSFSEFKKLDLRVGKVLSAEEVKGSRNLIRMEVDFGKSYGKKKILAGIADRYKGDELVNKKFIFVANLEPKQMMKEMSEGMILCADDDKKIYLLPVDESIPEGSVVR